MHTQRGWPKLGVDVAGRRTPGVLPPHRRFCRDDSGGVKPSVHRPNRLVRQQDEPN